MNGMTPKQPMRSVSMLDPGFAAMEKKLAGGASKANKPMKPPIKKGRQRMDFSKGVSLNRMRKEV